jgi:hypothetical protein
MRPLSILLVVPLVSTVYLVSAQESQSPTKQQSAPAHTHAVKRVHVTTKTIAAQHKGKSYVLDLTRPGTVYDVSAGVDYGRVTVHTDKGDTPLSEQAKAMHVAGTRFLAGSAEDLAGINFGFPPGGAGTTTIAATCNGLVCGCTGAKDCGDMKKKYKGQKFYCGTAPQASGTDGTNMGSYGRKPGTYGCVTQAPQ